MKKSSILISIFLIILSLSSCSVSSVHKKLIGRWIVELAEFSTGEIVENPDMVIVFSNEKYTVYTKGEENFTLYYEVKKDYISFYIETFWNGVRQGERLKFNGDDNLTLELNDELNGRKIELKYYLKRVKEENNRDSSE